MPDMKTLHSTTPRLTSRSSNGNIREGYATISSPSRRTSGFGSLFGNSGSTFGGGSIPPVPSLPSTVSAMNGGSGSGHESPGGVVRQPRGPGAGGFGSRRVTVGDTQSRGGLEARSHEPLEM